MNRELSLAAGVPHANAPAWLCRVRRFLRSPFLYALQFLLLALCMVQYLWLDLHELGGVEYTLVGVFACVALILLTLVLCDDAFVTTVPFLLLTVALSAYYDSYSLFIRYLPLAVPAVAVLIFHFAFYRGRYTVGRHFAPLLAVSPAMLLGGIGCLSAREYFSPAALYYAFALGLGMLGLYLLLGAQRARPRDYDLGEMLLKGLYLAALFAVFYTLCYYGVRWIWMVDDLKYFGHLRLISIGQRNVFATYMLLGLPAPFYFAQKGRVWHYGGALVIFAALFLTGSRGGMLMGTLTLILCYLYAMKRDVRRRRLLWVVLGACAVGLLAALPALAKFFFFRFADGFVLSDEPRVLLLKRAVQDFFAHPIFGVGLGYTGNADIYDPKAFAMNWYHMMIPQVVAGLGLVGTAAYGYMLFTRARVARERRDARSRALLLCYLALFLMSQVNPGEFCPIPYEMVAVMIFLFLEEPRMPTPLMQEQEQAALTLLSSALFEPTAAPPADTDYKAVLAVAEKHMIFGTLSEGLEHLPEDAVPMPVLLDWQAKAVALLRQNQELAAVEHALLAHLAEQGIPCVILKGSAVARHYKTPELRVQGDIDCLVRREDFDAVSEYLLREGFCAHSAPNEHHVAFVRGKAEIELHYAVMGLPEGELGERLSLLLSDVIDQAVLVPQGEGVMPVPAPFHQALILLLHMQQHMREGGLGLRQVADFALFLGRELDAPTLDKLKQILPELGLWRFFETLALLSVRHLGLPMEAVPFAAEADPALADALLADFMAGGNFGTGDESFAGSAVVTKDRRRGDTALGAALSGVAEKCRVEWPASRRCGVLLFFLVPFWCARRILTAKRRVRPLQMLHSAGKRGRLYDSLALFEPQKRK